MKVMLVPNYSREDAVEAARLLDSWLDGEGVEVIWANDKKIMPQVIPDPEGCSLVVSLGGDGTLLRAAKIVAYREIPILGLSFGHLGFLTGAGSEAPVRSVSEALAGEMHASRRATLEVMVEFERADGTTYTECHFALNDMALSRGADGSMIEFDVSVSGNHIDRLRADGFVVATATGSTGYALSAGGPIVTPEFNGCVCVPVAPHTILARAFLTAPSDVIELVSSPDRPVETVLFVDGQRVGGNDRVLRAEIKRGPGDVILLDSGAASFYGSVSRVFYGKVGRS